MSVERIAPLGQAVTDAAFMRVVGGAGPDHGRSPPPAFPPPETPIEAAPHLYDSLVLPIPEGAGSDDPRLPSSLVNHFYRTQAARAQIEPLVDGLLPDALLRREVETLLRRQAEARRLDVTRLIEKSRETPEGRLPSRNVKDARFTFRGRLAAADDEGRLKLFDLYLTRTGPRQWEAAVFDRDPSRAGQVFPRVTPPVETRRLLIDPATGLVMACVAQQMGASGFETAARAALFPAAAGRALLFPALAATAALLLAQYVSWAAAATLLTALALYTLGSERR
jgi:hypothetical protein